MRRHEQQKGSFHLTSIDDFIAEAANGHPCFYDADKKIYKVNFSVSNIKLNNGSMAYNPTIFNQLRNKPIVRDGLIYRSGIREVHAIKVVKTPDSDDNSQNKNEVVFGISLTPCPIACMVCYGPNRGFCDKVVSRHLAIPKEKFIKVSNQMKRSIHGSQLMETSPSKKKSEI